MSKISILFFLFFISLKLHSQTVNIISSAEATGSIERYDTLKKVAVKKLDQTQKARKKMKTFLLTKEVQSRIFLEKATTISNKYLGNYQKATIIKSAKEYIGTPYHYGGMTKRGIDCSALILNAFKNNDLQLPRTSIGQSKVGIKVKKDLAKPGDLIFFKTNRRRNRITHVGLITEVMNGKIKFIHASSSSGVMESSLDESYYLNRFAKIKRILE